MCKDFHDLINSIQQRAPSIFGWATITLGISPHSSFDFFRNADFVHIVKTKIQTQKIGEAMEHTSEGILHSCKL